MSDWSSATNDDVGTAWHITALRDPKIVRRGLSGNGHIFARKIFPASVKGCMSGQAALS
jgi:hypothetical protein